MPHPVGTKDPPPKGGSTCPVSAARLAEGGREVSGRCAHRTAGRCEACSLRAAGLPQLDPARGAALAALWSAVSESEAAGLPVPCRGPQWDEWTADDPRATARAALACEDCPALALCADYVARFPEPVGVWAGQTTTQRRRARHAEKSL
ncbi:WhiB family transcriptional regulator [Microbacterium sp. ZKA21]|uniref:WhiB family transcriptional regulator n=1 Tax=Microbacterium sp. ZKA21 TaxID=3381694 RepID=UPI003D21AF3B